MTYYFAEGATGGFFDLDIALANPNTTTVQAELTFLTEGGGQPITTTRTLAPTSRTTVRVDEIPGLETQNGISTIVRSPNGDLLLVDRLMRWSADGYGGHGARAIPQPGTRWLFAEGVQNGAAPLTGGLPYFDTFVLLSNANATKATATLRFLLEPSGEVIQTVDVEPNARKTVYAGSIPELVGRSFSLDVTSTLPILAERSTYFGTARLWDGGHGTPGAATPSTTWFHAEGATGTYFETFLTLGNPGTATAEVTLTYLLSGDTEITRAKTIPGGSRLTVNLEGEDPALANAAVSTLVTSNVPIVSERIMYWPESRGHMERSAQPVRCDGLRAPLGRRGRPRRLCPELRHVSAAGQSQCGAGRGEGDVLPHERTATRQVLQRGSPPTVQSARELDGAGACQRGLRQHDRSHEQSAHRPRRLAVLERLRRPLGRGKRDPGNETSVKGARQSATSEGFRANIRW